jgi:fatty acid desaturase
MSREEAPVIDYEGLARELDAVRAKAEAELGAEDLEHLKKIERWGKVFSAVGYATAWMGPNLLSAWCISQGSMVRWTMMMHHVGHRGYDRVPGVPERYTSKGFAVGSRRLLDWPDWIWPEAWLHEHNVLHHYHTSEMDDPDLVEENVRAVRESELPKVLKYAVVGFYALTWKWTYYAPNTYQVLQVAKRRRSGAQGLQGRYEGTYLGVYNPLTPEGRAFWKDCVLPYGGLRFVALPALYAPLGPWAMFSVLANSLGAELLTNLHTFVVIATNHAGDDLYRFDTKASSRGEFYARQVLSSVNFRLGNDVVDFLHGWLNYQIEHHLFPDLPMRKYQQIQPQVKEICERYGLPYAQEGVFKRVKRLVDIMVGNTSMKRVERVEKAAPARVAAQAAE